MLRGVIFDVDGVLVDSEQISTEAVQAAMPKLGLPPEVYNKEKFLGTSGKYLIDTINKTNGTSIIYEDFERLKHEEYMRLAAGNLKSFSGVVELLEALTEGGISIAVASSGSIRKVGFNLAEAGFLDYFQAIISGDHVLNAKPHPEIYLLSAQKLSLQPEDCVAIEDSIYGIRAAKSAGMKCLAVTNSFTSKELREADFVVKSLEEVTPEFLASLFD